MARRERSERIVTRVFVGTGPDAPFLVRHDWAIPALVFGGCGVFGAVTLWLTWIGWGHVLVWALIAVGALAAVLMVRMLAHLRRATRGPLPALDRTPRTATVVLNADNGEGHTLLLRYTGADGGPHSAQLADSPDDTWVDAFTPGSTWQVYTFRDPELADSVVFLTEAHDEVWRDGYVLDGVRIGGEGGPLTPGPGSPFLREDGKWRFAP
ncbi:hypothetical protein [Streptomyces profundus]|uniref:hypothetical protein n=1 Tax=Streptomyces profundus TaxID=2867410 RepID=UPI001D1672AE|nr:hypothetical protein [Streptomyces sp. MA3_2.13]UED86288.1 hypothetical protein K4G22_20540 [Streptomyces sp. MA3_2.13]